MAEYRDERENLRRRVAELERRLANAEAEDEALGATISELRGRLAREQAHGNEIQAAYEELKDQLAETDAARVRAEVGSRSARSSKPIWLIRGAWSMVAFGALAHSYSLGVTLGSVGIASALVAAAALVWWRESPPSVPASRARSVKRKRVDTHRRVKARVQLAEDAEEREEEGWAEPAQRRAGRS